MTGSYSTVWTSSLGEEEETCVSPKDPGFGFRVSGFGFRVPGSGFRVLSFVVLGFGFQVSGSGFRVSGLRRIVGDAEEELGISSKL